MAKKEKPAAKSDGFDDWIQVRCGSVEKARWQALAEEEGRSLSSWLRWLAQQAERAPK